MECEHAAGRSTSGLLNAVLRPKMSHMRLASPAINCTLDRSHLRSFDSALTNPRPSQKKSDLLWFIRTLASASPAAVRTADAE